MSVKRLLTMLLAICMVVSLLAPAVSAVAPVADSITAAKAEEEAKAKAEEEAKAAEQARLDRLANPTTEDLLKEILATMKKEA